MRPDALFRRRHRMPGPSRPYRVSAGEAHRNQDKLNCLLWEA
jgi:hypothetical protein